MSSLEPMYSPFTFGIDLGTSNSAIAFVFRGSPEVIKLGDQTTMPSVVHFRPEDVIVGRQARMRAYADPDNTVSSIKREMGTAWTKTFYGTEYTPTDISSRILVSLCDMAERSRSSDLEGTPHNVVICIPANFNDAQKNATRDAAKLANLNLLDLLEEPVAAAIAYAMEKERDQTILIYDLGGGTFDVCILSVNSTRPEGETTGKTGMKVLAKDGVPDLGGDDFDASIVNILLEDLKSKEGVDLSGGPETELNNKAVREIRQKLYSAAEAAKIDIGSATSTLIEIPDIATVNGKTYSIVREITREEFDTNVSSLLDRSLEAVDRALASAKLSVDDIDRVLLVGGSTKMPCVREKITAHFNREPYFDKDVDTAVARGAAIYAAALSAPVPVLEINNIVTHHLGIETPFGVSWMIAKGQEIPQDEPVSQSMTFKTQRDSMEEMSIRVYQSAAIDAPKYTGEDTMFIGEFFLTGIPPAPAGKELVDVTLEIDQSNLLTVTAVAQSTGESGRLEINRKNAGDSAPKPVVTSA